MKTKKAWESSGPVPQRVARKSGLINLNIFTLKWPLKDIYRTRAQEAGKKKSSQVAVNNSKVCQFHSAMKTVMAISQFFGIMPVLNILTNDVSTIHFKLLSFRTCYVFFCCLCLFSYDVLTLCWVLKEGVEFSRCVTIIFYTSNLLAMVCFLRLAVLWPKIIRKWQITEDLMSPLLKERSHQSLRKKLIALAVIVLSLSLTEHILSVATNIYISNICPNVHDKWRAMFMQQFNQLFTFTSYSTWKALIARYILSLGTFSWNYMDCFVILISVGLSQHFKMLNKELRMIKGKHLPQLFWERKRNHYRSLCDLCEKVDDAISKITIISFSNNLFFICVQLLNSMNKKPSNVHTIYFWFSLIFLMGRTLAVSLYSAEINDESKKIVEVIRVAPKESWCVELKRFYDEVTYDMVALTGMRFFYLTKRLVLSVAGTIITYELVLIQFDQDEETGTEELCSPIYN